MAASAPALVNALNKVVKGNWKPKQPIIINDLFDSRNPPRKPVFDNAFFIDAVDANGASFKSIGAYEEMVAQVVYMQLYAPMYNEMISVEDNLFNKSCVVFETLIQDIIRRRNI